MKLKISFYLQHPSIFKGQIIKICSILFFVLFAFLSPQVFSQQNDWRNIENAITIIPDENYCDQLYAVVNQNNEWVVVMTTGSGHEGQPGQHVVSTISKNKGKTWTPLVDLDPATGTEASRANPLIVPSGKIYVFYTYNAENRRERLNSEGEPIKKSRYLRKNDVEIL